MSDYKPTKLMLDWHAALLEPGRKQTTGRLGVLEDDGTVANCCLGVLAEVAGNEGKILVTENPFDTGSLIYNGPSANNDRVMPSEALTQLALGGELRENSMTVTSDIDVGTDSHGMTITAADLNDDFGFTFAEIAEQIRIVYIEGTGNHRDYEIEDLQRHESAEDDCDW